MATSTASIQRKGPLPAVELVRRMLEACRLQAVCLQEGAFGGDFGSCRQAGATFCSVAVDFALHGRFLPPPGHFISCYVHRAPPGSWCAGMPLLADTLLIALPDSACDLMLGAQAQLSAVLAPLHGDIRRAMERFAGANGVPTRQLALLPPEAHAATSWQRLYDMLRGCLIGENAYGLARLLEDMTSTLLASEYGLCALLAEAAAMPAYSRTQDVHYPALRNAVQFMREHLGRDLYMDEVAAAAQVSDRTLRVAFDALLGVSPTHYLGLLRLHEASRRLSGSGGQRQSIKAVAMDCGIWNLSRFAASYYRAFGERPSDTRWRASRSGF